MSTFASPADAGFKPQVMDLLFSTTLTSATDIVSTGTLPTGYKSYSIDFRGRSDNTASNIARVRVFFNSDLTVSNYQLQRILGSTPTFVDTLGQSEPAFFTMPGPFGGASDYFGGGSMQVYSPEATTGYKSYSCLTGRHSSTGTASGGRTIHVLHGVWRNTAAITEINFKMVGSPDLEVGTSFAVYGIR